MSKNKSYRSDMHRFHAFKSLPALYHKGFAQDPSEQAGSDAINDADDEPVSDSVEEFLTAVGWTARKWVEEYSKNIILMGQKPYNAEVRIDERLGQRLLATSGLSWNEHSHNKSRDWANTATAITMETALIELYRHELLKNCPGAQALRRELKAFLETLAYPFHTSNPTAPLIEEWDFADNIHVSEDGPGLEVKPVKTYNVKQLMTDWKAAQSKPRKERERVRRKGKGKIEDADTDKDPILAFVEATEGNKLLACSDPKACPGTIEKIAHFFITGLATVRAVTGEIESHTISFRLTQIMYINRARIEHDLEMDGTNGAFDASEVDIPEISRKPHSVSEGFSKYVGIFVTHTPFDSPCVLTQIMAAWIQRLGIQGLEPRWWPIRV